MERQPPEFHGAAQYVWPTAAPSHAHAYLLPALQRILDSLPVSPSDRRALDIGCGNGALDAQLVRRGWDITGIDPSDDGLRIARQTHPEIPFYQASAYDDLAAIHGTFPVVLSLEVIEHCYSPGKFAQTLFSCTRPGGAAIVSTPYHGYLKNLAMALSGKLDHHFDVLHEHGHIKFFSMRTLSALLRNAGFAEVRFVRAGRIPWLAKSMLAVARRSN